MCTSHWEHRWADKDKDMFIESTHIWLSSSVSMSCTLSVLGCKTMGAQRHACVCTPCLHYYYHVSIQPKPHSYKSLHKKLAQTSLHLVCVRRTWQKPLRRLNALTAAPTRTYHDVRHAVCTALCRLLRLLIAPAPVPTVDMDQLLRYGETMGPLCRSSGGRSSLPTWAITGSTLPPCPRCTHGLIHSACQDTSLP